MKKKLVYLFLLLWLCCNQVQIARAQFAMTNVYGRKYVLLNGKWDVIIDPYLHGHKDSIYKDKPLKSKSDFKEYAFEGGVRLNVPGDWNSQYPELKYYEGTVWYARHFSIKRSSDENVFLYFGAVNYQCTVYLNGTKVGGHEGGPSSCIRSCFCACMVSRPLLSKPACLARLMQHYALTTLILS